MSNKGKPVNPQKRLLPSTVNPAAVVVVNTPKNGQVPTFGPNGWLAKDPAAAVSSDATPSTVLPITETDGDPVDDPVQWECRFDIVAGVFYIYDGTDWWKFLGTKVA